MLNSADLALNYSFTYYRLDEPTLLRWLFVGPALLVPLGILGMAVRPAAGAGDAFRTWLAFLPAYALSVALFFVSSRITASLMAFGGILMALYRREKTGRGDYLDIAMLDSLLACLPNVLGPVFVEKRAPVPKHERSWGGAAFYRPYRTQDGRHVVLGAQEIKFVRNLLGEWGRLDLVELAERGPGPHQQPLADFLQGVFETRTQAEWEAWFARRDIGFAPVRNLREAFDEPQVRERGMLLVDEDGIEHVGVPIKFAREPARPRFGLPAAGQDNEALIAPLDIPEEREIRAASRTAPSQMWVGPLLVILVL